MQQLYVLHNTQEDISIPKQIQILDKKFQKTRELIIYLLQAIVEVAQYCEVDAKNRANKNITTKADLSVNTKIAGNELLWQILENKSFTAAVEELKITQKIKHPNIVEAYDLIELADTLAFTMEFVPGLDLLREIFGEFLLVRLPLHIERVSTLENDRDGNDLHRRYSSREARICGRQCGRRNDDVRWRRRGWRRWKNRRRRVLLRKRRRRGRKYGRYIW